LAGCPARSYIQNCFGSFWSRDEPLKPVSKGITADATALKRSVNKSSKSASSHFQLFSQNPMQHDKQCECGHDQHHRVESEDAKCDSEIPFLQTEEHVRLAAAAVIVLLHLGS